MLTDQQFAEIYTRYQSSGLSIRSFCQNERICEAKFYYWKKKMQSFLPGNIGSDFVPLVLREPGKSGIQINRPTIPDSFSGFEISYPNGTRLKFSPENIDLGLLRSLLSLQD